MESCFLTSDNLDYEIFFRSLIIFIKLFILRSSIYFLEKYSSLLQVPHIDLNRFIDDLEEIELGGLLQKIFKLDCWILLQCQISYILVSNRIIFNLNLKLVIIGLEEIYFLSLFKAKPIWDYNLVFSAQILKNRSERKNGQENYRLL